MARPMGIEPTSPEMNPGVLSQLNYGTVREAAHALRHPADAVLSHRHRM
jgi:hypothetical protein